MKTVLVGLVQGPIAWLAVSAAISYALQGRYGTRAGGTIGVSLVAGGCVWAAVGLLSSSVSRWRERAAINGGVAGVHPADGKAAVLVGTIEPTGPVLTAPLDGSPCVTYSYEIHDDRGQGKRRSITPVVRGVALTASTIVTRTGSHKLLVVPQIDAAEPVASRDEMIANFQQYATRTTFTARKGSADELLAQWNDADGEYRSDVRTDRSTASTRPTGYWRSDTYPLAHGSACSAATRRPRVASFHRPLAPRGSCAAAPSR